ncbi:GNAT family N-acetyltransferase [Kocuria sp. ZOR0020]|uniref:GNAT family N-acetyltransferase n=1 Tax=Kocuria sp. ZOR0020 TaxID=1339234 RepID=UPI0006470277|nr:GNAT family N-acetyltransferase [Kocuria sp. ZOR0020]
MTRRVRTGLAGDGALLHDLAVVTFHDACPPGVDHSTAMAHVETELSPARFEQWLADPDTHVVILEEDGTAIGYVVLVANRPVTATGRRQRPELAEQDSVWFLSKFYVVAEARGTGAARELMTATVDVARAGNASGVWLTVNQLNPRANAFYERCGFQVMGTTTFPMGGQLHDDNVRHLPLP